MIAGTLAVLAPTTPAAAQTFSDVSGGPHQAAISALASEGVAFGCTDTSYCPEAPVTRAQTASLIARALDLPDAEQSFSDVAPTSPHAGPIGALQERGITQGCTPTEFCPDETVSREQMASLIDRAFGLPAPTETIFFDVREPHAGSTQALGQAGVSAGCDALALEFCPVRPVRRDQMASFVARALELVPRESLPMLLEPGDRGPAVEALQRRLERVGYWVGPIDGVYGTLTEHAVLAVQKAHGLGRDGVYGPNTRGAVNFPAPPAPRHTSGYVVEFDENRQLVILARDGVTEWVFHASGGDESYYTSGGTTYWAETPNGMWDIYRQIDGWRTSHLGRLYRPKYFHTDGIAFHGYTDVPATAASHGCVRLSMQAMDWIWATNRMPIGTAVHVYGSPG